MSGVAGVCSGIMAVFHAQRVCPVENPCVWPSWVPPRRRACVYDAIFFGRSTSRINVLSSPCLCTANSGSLVAQCPSDNNGRNLRRLQDSDPRIPVVEKCGKIPALAPEVKVGDLHNTLILLTLLSDGH
jgi:hypothetical protein